MKFTAVTTVTLESKSRDEAKELLENLQHSEGILGIEIEGLFAVTSEPGVINWYDAQMYNQAPLEAMTEIISRGVTQEQFNTADEIIGDIANRRCSPDKVYLDKNSNLVVEWQDLKWNINKEGHTHFDEDEDEESTNGQKTDSPGPTT